MHGFVWANEIDRRPFLLITDAFNDVHMNMMIFYNEHMKVRAREKKCHHSHSHMFHMYVNIAFPSKNEIQISLRAKTKYTNSSSIIIFSFRSSFLLERFWYYIFMHIFFIFLFCSTKKYILFLLWRLHIFILLNTKLTIKQVFPSAKNENQRYLNIL